MVTWNQLDLNATRAKSVPKWIPLIVIQEHPLYVQIPTAPQFSPVKWINITLWYPWKNPGCKSAVYESFETSLGQHYNANVQFVMSEFENAEFWWIAPTSEFETSTSNFVGLQTLDSQCPCATFSLQKFRNRSTSLQNVGTLVSTAE